VGTIARTRLISAQPRRNGVDMIARPALFKSPPSTPLMHAADSSQKYVSLHACHGSVVNKLTREVKE